MDARHVIASPNVHDLHHFTAWIRGSNQAPTNIVMALCTCEFVRFTPLPLKDDFIYTWSN